MNLIEFLEMKLILKWKLSEWVNGLDTAIKRMSELKEIIEEMIQNLA